MSPSVTNDVYQLLTVNSPVDLASMVIDHRTEVDSLREENGKLNNEIARLEGQVEDLKDELSSLKFLAYPKPAENA